MSDPRPAPRRRRRRLAAALLATAAMGGATAACDGESGDVAVFGIELSPEYDPSLLRPGRVAVEAHNAPLPEMTPAEVAGLFRLPEGLPEALDLPAVAPGGWARSEHGRLLRLAIVFNADPPPEGNALCAAEAPIAAPPPLDDRYEAMLALCLRDQALAEGRIRARRSGALDAEWAAQTLAELLAAVLRPDGAAPETPGGASPRPPQEGDPDDAPT
ncbi:hypothetical protein [Albimonas pacifica]|uniref:Lipoprotein n=1 Tax=Albimonas pacifica TaxID=1114924 RepID=A0A1I3IEJ3_9RHOB|nr:hypothetical protein [Albimonas pacifica]SFI46414.1 hypothetical protein SAMN05216258_10710 [Albimonas pacifica]